MLKVAVVLSSATPAAWVVSLLDKLDQQSRVTVQIVLVPALSAAKAPANLALKLCHQLVIRYIDRPLFNEAPCQPSERRYVPQTHDIDSNTQLVLNLTESPLPESLAGWKNKPVWSVHSETLDARIEHALLTRAPLFWVHLWQETGVNSAKTVTRVGSHALPRQSFSVSDLQRAAFWCLPAFIASRINWLSLNIELTTYEAGDVNAQDPLVKSEYQEVHADAQALALRDFWPKKTGYLSTASHFIRLFYRFSLERIKDHIWYEQWQLAVSPKNATTHGAFKRISSTPIHHYKALPTPNKLWRADPHLFNYQGQMYVFFEEMPFNGTRGYISVAKLLDNGYLGEVSRVLDENKHLSYPFVFSHRDRIYMLPETASEGTISLYECKRFPDQWEHSCDLLNNIDSADTTLYQHNNHWWMFTNSQTHRTVNERDELNIYYAAELKGPWLAHPMNPIITGVDRARMAGPLFQDDGILYRPSQYGAKRYGYGININRIDQLTTDAYQETPVTRMVPTPGSVWLGCHSVGHLNGLTIIDRVTKRKL